MDADELLRVLLNARNPDGGWPFQRGRSSWTEPTALALLALQSADYGGSERVLAATWLANRQARDGGWAPCDAVPHSTAVTSIALLSLYQETSQAARCAKPALDWIVRHVYPDNTTLAAVLQRWLGVAPSRAPGSSPWFPGTAGWIIPTSLSILALSRFAGKVPAPAIPDALRRARSYLLSRRCEDGGWNHGGSPHRSEASTSYAETTGIALLALAGYESSTLAPALARADRLVNHPDSSQGNSWLVMGLMAHGRAIPQPLPDLRPKTTSDVALCLIAHASRNGRNPLLPAS